MFQSKVIEYFIFVELDFPVDYFEDIVGELCK